MARPLAGIATATIITRRPLPGVPGEVKRGGGGTRPSRTVLLVADVGSVRTRSLLSCGAGTLTQRKLVRSLPHKHRVSLLFSYHGIGFISCSRITRSYII